jgi:hypothetical protein
MNTFISPALDAANLLALARLEDDGAPPAVSPPQPADGPRSHAIRVARTGQPAASQQSDRAGAKPAGLPGGARRAGRRVSAAGASRENQRCEFRPAGGPMARRPEQNQPG